MIPNLQLRKAPPRWHLAHRKPGKPSLAFALATLAFRYPQLARFGGPR